MISLNESIVEDAALTWFGELGYVICHVSHMAFSEIVADLDFILSRIIVRQSAYGRQRKEILECF